MQKTILIPAFLFMLFACGLVLAVAILPHTTVSPNIRNVSDTSPDAVINYTGGNGYNYSSGYGAGNAYPSVVSYNGSAQNPISIYCTSQGGNLTTTTNPDGSQSVVCVLSNRTETSIVSGGGLTNSTSRHPTPAGNFTLPGNSTPPQPEKFNTSTQPNANVLSKEAIDACQNQTVGSQCQFNISTGVLTGVCNGNAGGILICSPNITQNGNQTPAMPLRPTGNFTPPSKNSMLQTCAVPADLQYEYNSTLVRYQTAVSENDTAAANAANERLIALNESISDTQQRCVGILSNGTSNESGLISYYQGRISEITTGNASVGSRIDALNQLKNEIDGEISALIQTNGDLNATQVGPLVNRIMIGNNKISADNATVGNATEYVIAVVNNRTIRVRPNVFGASIEDGQLNVSVPNVAISNGSLSVNGSPLKLAPFDIQARLNLSIRGIGLSTENGTLVYNVNGTEQRRLLGILPVTISKRANVDANSGNVVSENGPWWEFLTTGSK